MGRAGIVGAPADHGTPRARYLEPSLIDDDDDDDDDLCMERGTPRTGDERPDAD